jgi:hypothetical protein
MNIFATHPSAKLCAEALDDRRLVKMVLETAQLISTTWSQVMGVHLGYRPTHVNHPCAVWARASSDNLSWLILHAEWLLKEYSRRYDREHASSTIILCAADRMPELIRGKRIPVERTEFVNCARSLARGLDFTHVNDVHSAYRQYMAAKWKVDGMNARWTRRGPPTWYRQMVQGLNVVQTEFLGPMNAS